ncbi:RluA family pseudouridine synthase [Ottowia flava]|uniref:RluA family pseudouridine synthase n=1 Tax=Ottowia sp. GY511 TaxID=2603274 RepID=UPI00351BD722
MHEDAHLLVLDKPAGLLAVPGRGPDKADCLSARALRRWPDALVVHRLDQATSGLIVLARSLAVQRQLSADFAERRVAKRYEALVHGRLLLPPEASADAHRSDAALAHGVRAADGLSTTPADGWGLIDLPLLLDWPNRPRSRVDPLHGKPSQTHWRPLAHDPATDTTRVALAPVTGRSHQLRVHLMALGHPIVGDALYGPPHDAAARLMLHACALGLTHPATGEALRWHCAAPF